MPAVVLESVIGSQYDDSPASYEFPQQYLKIFDQVLDAGPLFAVLYEPRGDDGSGRMAYVGLARIVGRPTPTGGKSRSGRALYRVDYAEPAEKLDVDVPREVMGEPVESWMRAFPRGRARNVATFGRAVRPLTDEDFRRILELGGASAINVVDYPTRPAHELPAAVARERAERLASVLIREGSFRREVISAYDRRCAVSGFGLGKVSITKTGGVLDAAHIRPVRSDGTDHISNGLPLTPTLHRLFDAGLFTIAYEGGRPEVRVSPRLEPTMIASPERGFTLPLHDGLPLIVPRDQAAWPSPDQLRYHQREIFIRDGASLD